MLTNQVLAAPRIARFEDLHTVASRQELSYDPAEEVRIPVIPVRHERVVKHHDAHARSCRIAALRVSSSAYSCAYASAIRRGVSVNAWRRARIAKVCRRCGFS